MGLLKIYERKYKWSGHPLTKEEKTEPIKSLEDLGDVRSAIVNTNKFKTEHYRTLDFLRELYDKTKTVSQPGHVSLTELRNKHRVATIIPKILLERHLLIEINHNKFKPSYKWNTIPPVMATVEKLLEDKPYFEKQKQESKLVLAKAHEQKPLQPLFDMQQILEALKYHIPQQHIDYNVISNVVQETLTAMLPQMELRIMQALLAQIPQVAKDSVMQMPLPKTEIKIVEVEKVIEHHHHHITPEAKKSFFDKFKSNT
jgi:hypothetical protein